MSALRGAAAKPVSVPMDLKARARETAMKILARTHDDDLEHARGVGEIVITDMFDGDGDLYRARNTGPLRLKAILDEMKGLQNEQHWTMASLSRAVHLHLQWLEFKGFGAWPDLEVSHFYAVQPVEDYARQRKLLDMAQARLWKVRELAKEVAKVVVKQPKPPELRPSLKVVDRLAERLEKFVADFKERIDAATNDDSRIPPNAREQFDAATQSMLEATAYLRSCIQSWENDPKKPSKASVASKPRSRRVK